jgi:sec-independent protein translocase protein TatA
VEVIGEMRIGGPEIAIIVVAIVLIFGVGKLGDLGGALGKSIREFRRERDREAEDVPQALVARSRSEVTVVQPDTATTETKVCQNCGNKMSRKANFCMECGARV